MSYANFSLKYCSKDERRYKFGCDILKQPFLLLWERKTKLKGTFLSIQYRGIQGSLSVGSLTEAGKEGEKPLLLQDEFSHALVKPPTRFVVQTDFTFLSLFSRHEIPLLAGNNRRTFRGKVFQVFFFFLRAFKVTSVRTSANIIWQGALPSLKKRASVKRSIYRIYFYIIGIKIGIYYFLVHMQVSASVKSQWENNNREITLFLDTNITSS